MGYRIHPDEEDCNFGTSWLRFDSIPIAPFRHPLLILLKDPDADIGFKADLRLRLSQLSFMLQSVVPFYVQPNCRIGDPLQLYNLPWNNGDHYSLTAITDALHGLWQWNGMDGCECTIKLLNYCHGNVFKSNFVSIKRRITA